MLKSELVSGILVKGDYLLKINYLYLYLLDKRANVDAKVRICE